MAAATSSSSSELLASFHDLPVPGSGGVYVSSETGSLAAREEDYARCWGWFRTRLLREPLGPELFQTARRVYHAGMYDSAAVIMLLFRGAHPEIRVRGVNTDDLEVVHLWAHLLWKMGLPRHALEALTKVVSEAPKGLHQFEECWQLIVELGFETESAQTATGGESVPVQERPLKESIKKKKHADE